MIIKIPTFENILAAKMRINGFVHKTPVFTSVSINKIVNCEIFFKCENLQKVGAFKFRGATNAVFSLTAKEAANGVATHSSGNHAAALALAAQMRGIKAYVVMPRTAPQIKKIAVEGYGAEITYCEPTLQARESTLNQIVTKTSATFVHPYSNFNVICGQGTAAVEFLEEIQDLDIMMTPVGGGGLLSGTAIASKAIKSDIQVIAAEPEGANDAFQSFTTKTFVPSVQPKTIADGLLTSIGDVTYKLLIDGTINNVLTAEENSIIAAMRLIWERMKIIVEPSSAVPLAAIMENKEYFAGKKVGIIISGGNVDLENLPF